MQRFVVIALVVLAACTPRAEITYAPAALSSQPPVPVFVGTTRGPDPDTGADLTRGRSETLRFARFDVSVPPDRKAGTIPLPPRNRAPDPMREFSVSGQQLYSAKAAFRADLSRALASHGHEAVIFVHGYNNTLADGVYRFAQMGRDLKLPGVLVHYSWPSRANVFGYAYDRDSALFARDGFERLLREVSAAGARRIVIVAHSMGGALTMETLRQIAISGDGAVRNRIAGVVLISPDLDVDVFRSQARRIGRLPQPFIIFTSERDRALALSARVAGEGERLGNLRDVTRVADLEVTMVEVGAYSSGDGHFTVGSSPTLLALLGREGELNAAFAGDRSGQAGLLPGFVLTVRDATRIVLAPVEELAEGMAN